MSEAYLWGVAELRLPVVDEENEVEDEESNLSNTGGRCDGSVSSFAVK